jgi:hypothetical protein
MRNRTLVLSFSPSSSSETQSTASYVFIHPWASTAQAFPAITFFQTGGRWLTRKGCSVKRYVDEMLFCFSVM